MPQVMPLDIRIICHDTSGTKMYDENQHALMDIRHPNSEYNSIIHQEKIEFSDSLYCEILSLSDIDDISAFCNRYPTIRFFFKGQELIHEYKDFITEEDYYSEIKHQMDFFRDYMSQYSLVQKMKSLSDEEMFELYSQYCRIVANLQYSTPLKESNINRCFDAAVRECGLTRTYHLKPALDNRLTVIGVLGEISEQKKSEIFRRYQALYIGAYKVRIKSKLAYITKENITFFDPNTGTIKYECPTVLSAMYAMLVVSEFNKDTYKICAHEGCHNYFKVDKTHPQTRCPEHMKSRQTRRQNARTRQILSNNNILRDKKKEQAYEIQRAAAQYEKTNDINAYIRFWEDIWSSDKGFLFQNNQDAFTLADLYMQEGRYEDALAFVKRIGKIKCFSETATTYIKLLNPKVQVANTKAKI